MNGKETGRFSLVTAESKVQLYVQPDKTELSADGEDLSFITVKMVDEKNVENLWESKKVSVSVEGKGTLAAFGSADPQSLSSYDDKEWEIYDGYVMAVVRAGTEEG